MEQTRITYKKKTLLLKVRTGRLNGAILFQIKKKTRQFSYVLFYLLLWLFCVIGKSINLSNYNKMSSSDIENDRLTPESFRSKAAVIVDDLLPPKSRELYLKTYNLFCDWKTTNGANSFSECIFLNYFNELTKTKKPSTLWSIYSMLKATVRIKHNIDISNYSKLVTYLKRLSEGNKPKKSRVLSSENIERFLNDAPDHSFLAVKVSTYLIYVYLFTNLLCF